MAALSGNVIFTRELGHAISRLEWPCYYLDFETVATTLRTIVKTRDLVIVAGQSNAVGADAAPTELPALECVDPKQPEIDGHGIAIERPRLRVETLRP